MLGDVAAACVSFFLINFCLETSAGRPRMSWAGQVFLCLLVSIPGKRLKASLLPTLREGSDNTAMPYTELLAERRCFRLQLHCF